ncbi:MAG: threonine ammonia-lyase [Chloroflexi bacterium]|nr:threonine ammonia-lyase [Chloroflexota bacterium]MYD64779.1 threonine ammonia-lyase [Chloroflexota bacterium]
MSTTIDAVTIEDVHAARARIAGAARVTPMWPSVSLSDLAGVPVLLKCEHLQRGGSFKFRGASNMLGSLAEPPRGVIAASAGNHAQGVALAAAERGIPATVVMPANAPLAKQAATRGYEAEVVLVDGPLEDCIAHAQEMAAERDLLFVPPFDNPAIVAGQATLGLEVIEQAPEATTVIVPAGGGGLLAGVGLAVKSLRPDIRVIGAQSQAMPGVVASLLAGAPRTVPFVQTLADGAAVAGPSALTLELIERYVDDVVAVHEEDIARTMVLLIERTKFVIEGAGALGIAALLARVVEADGPVVPVLSGGNVDINLLDRIVERGLTGEGRRRTITFETAHAPGELARISRIIAAQGVNVIEVEHDLVDTHLPVGAALLSFRLDIAGDEAYEELSEALREAGMRPGTVSDFVTPAAQSIPP